MPGDPAGLESFVLVRCGAVRESANRGVWQPDSIAETGKHPGNGVTIVLPGSGSRPLTPEFVRRALRCRQESTRCRRRSFSTLRRAGSAEVKAFTGAIVPVERGVT